MSEDNDFKPSLHSIANSRFFLAVHWAFSLYSTNETQDYCRKRKVRKFKVQTSLKKPEQLCNVTNFDGIGLKPLNNLS